MAQEPPKDGSAPESNRRPQAVESTVVLGVAHEFRKEPDRRLCKEVILLEDIVVYGPPEPADPGRLDGTNWVDAVIRSLALARPP